MSAVFAHLLPLLRDPDHVREMSLADWDTTLRLARQARLLGLIAHRLVTQQEKWERVPAQVKGHLRSAINYSAHRRQMVSLELSALDTVLPPEVPVVLLKGAAYLAQSMQFSLGRMPNDVDLLVSRADIDAVEKALLAGGWESEVTDAYDQRYYREWSHELPPMRCPGHALEVDLHHTIAPITSRTRADDALLFADLVALPESRFFVLDGRDQIIHAAIHLFQDTELDGRLRDLVDIDGLARHHLRGEADWSALLARATRHRASRMLWYALHFCHAWLGSPVPVGSWPPAPGALARLGMKWLMQRNCLPRIPDGPPPLGARLGRNVGQIRYHFLRMPPGLLVRHLLHKTWRGVRLRASPHPGAAR